MKLSTLAAAAALVVGAGSAIAGDQSIDLSSGVASFQSKDSLLPVFQGGDDLISFTNLGAGLYDFTLTLSGQWLTMNWGATNLNGVTATLQQDTGKMTFLGIEGTDVSPFVLTLVGTTDHAKALYSGEMSVTAVPEPQTYAMMLAGLGALGFMSRRRRAQA